MPTYLFSEFSPEEKHSLCLLLQEVFHVSEHEFTTFYKDIIRDFNVPGWEHRNWLPRSVFASAHPSFQSQYQQSPVIGIDLPSTFELSNGKLQKPTIAILAQDSLRDVKARLEPIEVGTPFGLDHIACRTQLWTKIYMQLVDVLVQMGYRVYLTDLIKVWVSNGTKKGIPLPKADRERFAKRVPKELETFQVGAVITWGKPATLAVRDLHLDIPHLEFPHPSGANNGYWKKKIGMAPTWTNKRAYFQARIQETLKATIA